MKPSIASAEGHDVSEFAKLAASRMLAARGEGASVEAIKKFLDDNLRYEKHIQSTRFLSVSSVVVENL